MFKKKKGVKLSPEEEKLIRALAEAIERGEISLWEVIEGLGLGLKEVNGNDNSKK